MDALQQLTERVEKIESKIDRLIWTIAVAGCTGSGTLLVFVLQTVAAAHGVKP